MAVVNGDLAESEIAEEEDEDDEDEICDSAEEQKSYWKEYFVDQASLEEEAEDPGETSICETYDGPWSFDADNFTQLEQVVIWETFLDGGFCG
jgi:hypothetical protein